MKFKLIVLAVVIGLIFISTRMEYFSSARCSEGTVMPVFSPYGSDRIFGLIREAKHEIKLEVYEFSSKVLADAIIDASGRGISVKVILEPSVFNNKKMFDYLLNSGIDVSWAPEKFHNTHSKFMVIDGEIVWVGSMNWSENAMKSNREASVIVYSKEISGEFERIFDMDFGS